MKFLFTSEAAPVSVGLQVGCLMCAAVKSCINQVSDNAQLELQLQTLLNYLEGNEAQFPGFTQVHHPNLRCRASVIQWDDPSNDGDSAAESTTATTHVNSVLRLTMPCQESDLWWMPWMPQQTQPRRNPCAYFHPIVIAGRTALQARTTKCYDHAYAYSGRTHPIESSTPTEITQLYDHVNVMFDLPRDGLGGVNMCLENDYANGRYFIGEHSDDVRSFGAIHDVFCFVTGPAAREGIFRVRKCGKGKGGDTLKKLCCDPQNADKTRELVRIRIPAGLYVMRGRAFQQRYTHEFPQLHEHLFRRICDAEPRTPKHRRGQILPGFPVDIENAESGPQKTFLQATWIQQHRDLVMQKIKEGAFCTTPRHRIQTTPRQDQKAFQEWCLWRTSYTLRNFRVSKPE